jgi:Arc/MetJ family transcription regulator
MCIVSAIYTQYTHQRESFVRTNIVIDEELMENALEAGGFKTKKEAVEAGLKLIVQINKQKKIKNFKGKLKWTGSLSDMRKSP